MSQADNTHTTTPLGTPVGSAASNPLKELERRELLRGGVVAALALGAAAVVPFVARASDDPLLDLLNRYLAENAWLDAYHADIDERRDELGWDRVEELLTETLKASDARCEAMLREMVRLPGGAASSIAVLDLVSEQMEIGESIFQEHYVELLKSVRTYIASIAEVRS